MSTEFGTRLRMARRHARLSQKALAALVGLSQSNISELEDGGYESGKTAQIAHACGVDAQWLATGAGHMVNPSLEAHAPVTPKLELIEALRRLCAVHGVLVVADTIGANDQTLKQILVGTKLPSGEPRGVGPNLQRRLLDRTVQ